MIVATAPQKAGLTLVSESALRDALRSRHIGVRHGAGRRQRHQVRELLAKSASGQVLVTGRREIQEIGVTVLTLSNGVSVWLKPTDFRNDQITYTSFARGGTSIAGDQDYWNAAYATSRWSGLSGFGGISPTDRGKLLAGKLAQSSPYISTYTQGVRGSASPKDLETALQLTYLDFTAPNHDVNAFTLMKRQLDARVANQGQSPGQVFGERRFVPSTR